VTDEELAAAYVRARDPDLFRTLVERHQARVHRLVASLLGPFADTEAQEVTQEVFVRVHERLATFRGEARFSSWLYRLAYNRALEQRRLARLRRPHVPFETIPEKATTASPLDDVLRREREDRVLRWMDGLPDLYRSTLYLHYWLDASVEEIAELLGAPTGTVKSYLSRARERLRRQAKADGTEVSG